MFTIKLFWLCCLKIFIRYWENSIKLNFKVWEYKRNVNIAWIFDDIKELLYLYFVW